MATFHPNKAHNINIISGFINGEAIKKLIAGPKGTLEFNRPASIGIVEQEQNGVTAPNIIPNI